MTMNTVTRSPVRTPDSPARRAWYRLVYAAAVAGRGWPADPWPLP